MSDDLKWLATGFVSLLAIILGSVRHVNSQIRNVDDTLSNKIKDGDDTLHVRVNDVRKEHVHKDDFKSHIDRIERMTERIETGITATNKRIDEFIIKADR